MPSASREEAIARFESATRRLHESAEIVARLGEAPTLKQMGMVISSMLLRVREVNLRWQEIRSLDPAAAAPAPDEAEAPPPASTPHWPVPRGEWFASRCDALLHGFSLVPTPSGGIDPTWFAAAVWPAIDGPDGLLKGLPKMHEEVTRLIYQEEFFSGE